MADAPIVDLTAWTGPWPADDPDANFKADVALYATADPLRTIRGLSRSTGIPVGALVRYVLARWASEGASGLLELGPTMTRRLQAVFDEAESSATDEARLAGYHQARQMIAWLNHPLDHPDVYEQPMDRVARARSLADADEARAVYDGWAVSYDEDVIDRLGFIGHRLVAERMVGLAGTGAQVLDVGCGTGVVGEALAELGVRSVDGLDLSPKMLKVAGHKGAYGRLIEADLNRPLDLPDASYDAVVSAGTFVSGHVGADAIPRLLRLLRPGGVLVATVMAELWEPGGFAAVLSGCEASDGLRVLGAEPVVVSVDGRSSARLMCLQVSG